MNSFSDKTLAAVIITETYRMALDVILFLFFL